MKLTQNGNLKLTARELEILTCWLFGYSAKAIAALFHISVRTVESHIDHIKDKLSCHSKYDLQDLINSKNIYHLFNDLYLLILKPSI